MPAFPKRTFLIAIVIFIASTLFPFVSYGDFTSMFSGGARLTTVADDTVVGNFSGKFSVNPAGSAVYDIALAIPPGTAKMAPSLSLHYDSSGGNGILGMGFNLQGLTAITRVSSNYAQNGMIHGVDFTSADRLALNGEQLVSTGGTYGADGTEYRTYIDSQARVISQGVQGNGPAGFVVQTKGGQTAWYGTTSDSQILAQGTTTVAVWALAKIQDQAGNYITYHYNVDAANGMYYPSEIDYTANDAAGLKAYNAVKFIYETRPDPITTYQAGSLFKTTQRLKEIQVYQGTPASPASHLVYDYHLNYELAPNTYRSRITSIQQCDGAGNCLRPLQFTWQTNAAGWTLAPSSWNPPVRLTEGVGDPHISNADFGVRIADVYGNGHPELLQAYGETNIPNGTPQNPNAPQPILPPGPSPESLASPGTNPIANPSNFAPPTEHRGAWKASASGWVPDPNFTPQVDFSLFNDDNASSTSQGVELADLAGDGKVHMLQGLFTAEDDIGDGQDHYSTYYTTSHYVAGPHGWIWQKGFPIPGSPTLGGQYKVTYQDHESIVSAPPTGMFADLQGTGQLSLLSGLFHWSYLTWKYDPSTASNWASQPAYSTPRPFADGPGFTNIGASGLQVADLTGNGLPDLLIANDGEQHLWLNTGSGWSLAPYKVPTWFRFVVNGCCGLGLTKDGGGRLVALTNDGRPSLIMSQNGVREVALNTGKGFIPGPSTLVPNMVSFVHGDQNNWYDDGVQFVDVTGSGLPAMLHSSLATGDYSAHPTGRAWLNENGTWVEHDEYGAPWPLTDALGKSLDIRFVDLLGTGFPDVIMNTGNGNAHAWLNKAQTKPDVVTTIQDGLGDHLQIQYKPITDNSIYTKGTTSVYPNMDVQSPIYVVTQTASDTDVTPATLPAIQKKLRAFTSRDENTTQHITTYHYGDAVLNHLGWGFLGFGQVTTTDQYTGLNTTVTYSQDTDHHTQGMPVGTSTTKKDGTLLNQQTSTFQTKVFGDPSGKVNASWYFPYVNQTIETAYDYNGTPTNPIKLSTKTTTTQMDDYGNPTDILETDVDSSGTYTTETKNTYINHLNTPLSPTGRGVGGEGAKLGAISQPWLIGELTQAQVTATSTPTTGEASSITRTTAFTYDSTTGFLTSSTLEPNSSTNQLTKTYTRDSFGNIIQTDITGSNIQARSEKASYDPTGAYIISKTNALNQTINYQVDPRFGAITQVTDPNGLTEVSTLDSFGRVIQVQHPDKTIATMQYQWASSDAAAPQGSVYEVIQTQAGTPTKVSYHDELDREIAQTMQGFAGQSGDSKWIWQMTNYDQVGRTVGKTLPFYAGTPSDQIYLTTMQYDDLGRVIKTNNPDGTSVTQSYNGYTTTTTNAKGQTTTRTTNVRGNLLNVIDSENHTTAYQYDAFNDLIQLTDSASHISTMAYDNLGHKLSMHDVDRSDSTYSYDALGELLSQTDANHQTTTFTYDALGRMVARTDNANTPNATSSTWQYDTAPHGIGKLATENGVSNFTAPFSPTGRRAGDEGAKPTSFSSNTNETFQQQLQDELTHKADPSNLDKPKVNAIPSGIDITAPNAVQRLNAAKDNLIDYSKTYTYDELSRLSATTISMQGQNYTTTTSYDQNSRPSTVTYPDNVSLTNQYDALGYALKVIDNKTGVTYSTVNSMDAAGHVTSITHSNGLTTNYTYDPKTNFLTNIQTNTSTGLQLERQLLPTLAHEQEKQNQWKLDIHAKASTNPNADNSGVAKVNAMLTPLSPTGTNWQDCQFGRTKCEPKQSEGSRDRMSQVTGAGGEGAKPAPLQDTGPLQDLNYTYDAIGNVQAKEDKVLNVQDNYQYDDLNRLTQDQTVDNAHSSQTTNLNYAYDDLGNIKTKSDVGNYTYAQNNAGPHAVTSIGGGSETDQFQYDANGNQTQAIMQLQDGSTTTRNISYTSFDVPKTITQTTTPFSSAGRRAGDEGASATTATINFYYNADRKRFMRQDQVTAPDPTTHQLVTTKTTTLYLDGMEIDTTTDATGKITNTFKNYIGDAELILDDQGNRTTYDILKDNIGSTNVVTDQNGNVVQRFHYDPFGEQQLVDATQASSRSLAGEGPGVRTNTSMTTPRNTSKVGDINPQDRTSITRYGFTGQEEVNAGGIDLIHMNGRMYDPHLGRFLSADPIIQDPSNSQCLNRYSYCNNNPIAAVDPSGFSWFSDLWDSIRDAFKDIFHGIGQVLRNPVVGQILEIAVAAIAVGTLGPGATALTMFGHFAGAAAFNGVVSYAQTGSIGLGLKTAAFTLLSEYAWAATGAKLGGVQNEIANPVKSTLAHGMVGGSLNAIEGGSFKNGFLSAAVSEALTGPVQSIKISGEQNATIMARGLASGVVGGTVAAATGGNFENGMMTSAMAEIFNAQDKDGESIIGKWFNSLVTTYGPAAENIVEGQQEQAALQNKLIQDHPVAAAGAGFGILALPFALGSGSAVSLSDILMPNGELIGEAGSDETIRELSGGVQAAESMLQKLTDGGTLLNKPNYPGQLYSLSDGGYIGYRPISTSGPPTIDINVPGLDNITKLKFLG
jgi:RHS repeat-associated protein